MAAGSGVDAVRAKRTRRAVRSSGGVWSERAAIIAGVASIQVAPLESTMLQNSTGLKRRSMTRLPPESRVASSPATWELIPVGGSGE